MNKVDRIKELIKMLNKASFEYYQLDNPSMSDKKYDSLYDELESLEKETGIIMANSPTQKVQGFILDGLVKVKHSKPMLSAAKTKSQEDISKFISGHSSYASYKLDGLTVILTYDNGELISATTRGNGEIGEDITMQAKMITNIPLKIPYENRLELRGECFISWDNFKKINETLAVPYSHPRNLAAGSIRQLDTNITKSRKLDYIVFEVVSELPIGCGGDSKIDCLNFIDTLGLITVTRFQGTISDTVNELAAENSEHPVDGIIFELNSRQVSKELGATGHHENCRMALKMHDDTYETILRNIEWNTSKSGLVNPVAIFDKVDLDGALTTKATLHNVSYIEGLQLGIGDTITVYRANMVIPKVDDNLTRSNTFIIPDKCPCCGAKTIIKKENDSKMLYCPNMSCSAQLHGKLVHYCSRNAMNIEGMSEATLQFLIEKQWVKDFIDLYSLKEKQSEWEKAEGFGKKSVNRLLDSINIGRKTSLDRFIYSLSIPLIGRSASKVISKHFKGDFNEFYNALVAKVDLTVLEDFGFVMNQSIHTWFENCHEKMNELAAQMLFERQEGNISNDVMNNHILGKTIVITGSLNHFVNRDEAKEKIERLGGKVSGSVSSKSSYLVNNDLNSLTGKNKKAKELGIPIISEEQLLQMIG